MSYFRYENLEDGKFVFKCDDEIIISSTDNIWLFIDNCEGFDPVLLKHGTKNTIQKKYNSAVEVYKLADGLDHRDLIMIEITNLSLENINKCINNTGYIKKILKAHDESK